DGRRSAMESQRHPDHSYRMSGADRESGKDVEITVRASDEEEAYGAARCRGVVVAACVEVSATGTFYDVVTNDPVMRRLLAKFPQLGYRLKRFNKEDEAQLSDLS